jgi:hypothetical protein
MCAWNRLLSRDWVIAEACEMEVKRGSAERYDIAEANEMVGSRIASTSNELE